MPEEQANKLKYVILGALYECDPYNSTNINSSNNFL